MFLTSVGFAFTHACLIDSIDLELTRSMNEKHKPNKNIYYSHHRIKWHRTVAIIWNGVYGVIKIGFHVGKYFRSNQMSKCCRRWCVICDFSVNTKSPFVWFEYVRGFLLLSWSILLIGDFFFCLNLFPGPPNVRKFHSTWNSQTFWNYNLASKEGSHWLALPKLIHMHEK